MTYEFDEPLLMTNSYSCASQYSITVGWYFSAFNVMKFQIYCEIWIVLENHCVRLHNKRAGCEGGTEVDKHNNTASRPMMKSGVGGRTS